MSKLTKKKRKLKKLKKQNGEKHAIYCARCGSPFNNRRRCEFCEFMRKATLDYDMGFNLFKNYHRGINMFRTKEDYVMKKCSSCGLVYENYMEICPDCGEELVPMEFKWYDAAESEYRKQYGTLPELNFTNGQNGLDSICPTQEVVHSSIAQSTVTSSTLAFGKGYLKGTAKMVGKTAKGLLKMLTGDVKGLGDILNGYKNMLFDPFKNMKDGKDMNKEIINFENEVWPRLWFIKNFQPVTTLYGENYYVSIDGTYCGFNVFEDGSYFEGCYHGNGNMRRGIFVHSNGTRFLGEFNEDNTRKKGLALNTDGAYYDGDFANDYPGGDGYYLCDGYFYYGQWNGGCREGVGAAKKKNGEVYVGLWELDSPKK